MGICYPFYLHFESLRKQIAECRRINASVITKPCAGTTWLHALSESRAHPHVRVRPRRRGPHPSHIPSERAGGHQVPGTNPSLGWTPAWARDPRKVCRSVHTDSAEAAGVSALLSRALTDSGMASPTVQALPLNQRRQPDTDPLSQGYQLTVTGGRVVAAYPRRPLGCPH